MAELEEMIAEILHELDDMSPEDIEEIRTEWLAELKKSNPKSYEKVANFVNVVSDVAISRAKRAVA